MNQMKYLKIIYEENEMEFLAKLMCTMIDEGVKIPKAQVERYISPILTIFLPELLSKIYTNEYIMIMPEFPIRKGTLKGNSDNQSKNIDYLIKLDKN